jgi:transposase
MATAIVSAVGGGKQFRTARDLAAWLGLTPAQYSTGGETTLLEVSKRGNSYVRRLLIHGTCSCVCIYTGPAIASERGWLAWNPECTPESSGSF